MNENNKNAAASTSNQKVLAKLRLVADDKRVKALLAAFDADTSLYLVGGSVRDIIMGREGSDLDFAVSISPQEVLKILTEKGIHTIPTGLRHQTVTAVPVPEMGNVEITTFRAAGMKPEGGLVQGNDIAEDLQFRDFTINALAYDLKSHSFVDNCGGTADIAKQVIRAVGDAATRFEEDPLRILRMVRFAATLDFAIAPETWAAAKLRVNNLQSVSIERIRDEFDKILTSNRPDWAIKELIALEAMPFVIPEVLTFVNFEQNEFHKTDLLNHSLEVVRNCSPDLILRLAALFHDVSKPDTLTIDADTQQRHFFKHEVVGADKTEKILKRLKYSNQTIQAVKTLVYTHMRPIEAGPGGLRRILRDTEGVYPLWRELKEKDSRACRMDDEELSSRLAAFDELMIEVMKGPAVSPLKSLAINGNDLMALGIPEGRKIGEVLRALHEQVLDNPELNEREVLLNLAKQFV